MNNNYFKASTISGPDDPRFLVTSLGWYCCGDDGWTIEMQQANEIALREMKGNTNALIFDNTKQCFYGGNNNGQGEIDSKGNDWYDPKSDYNFIQFKIKYAPYVYPDYQIFDIKDIKDENTNYLWNMYRNMLSSEAKKKYGNIYNLIHKHYFERTDEDPVFRISDLMSFFDGTK